MKPRQITISKHFTNSFDFLKGKVFTFEFVDDEGKVFLSLNMNAVKQTKDNIIFEEVEG